MYTLFSLQSRTPMAFLSSQSYTYSIFKSPFVVDYTSSHIQNDGFFWMHTAWKHFYGLRTSSLMAVLILCLFMWRFWTFTLAPKLWPHMPKEIPYWIPIVGHTLSFFTDMNAFLLRSRDQFPGSSLPFAVTLAGQKLYIIRAPSDISYVYKNTTDLTFDGFVRKLMLSYGLPPIVVAKLFRKDKVSASVDIPISSEKSLVQRASEAYKQQLLPGQHLEDLAEIFVEHIQQMLNWERLPKTPNPRYDKTESKTISLMDLCGQVLVQAGTATFFGNQLTRVDSDILSEFLKFNAEGWKLLFQYPRFAAPQMFASKAKCIDAIERYLELPLNQRSDACWLVRSLEPQQRALGLCNRDIATIQAMLYWVANSNAYKVIFWIVAHLLFDETLMSIVEQEINSAFVGGQLDRRILTTEAPHLESVYLEVLRLANDASSIREIEKDVTVSGLKLAKGNRVLIPYRLMHCVDDAFGDQADRIDPYRFWRNGKLAKRADFRPFGGGLSYCPGRYIAKQECFAFVAILLHRYKIGLAQQQGGEVLKQSMPDLDHGTPYMGIVGPAEKGDLLVSVKERANHTRL